MIKRLFKKGAAVLTAALMLGGMFANTALAVAPPETKAINETDPNSQNYVYLNEYSQYIGNNVYKVTLTVGASAVPKPLDIVIVLDASGSMASPLTGDPSGTRWDAAIAGARAAVDIFFDPAQNPSASLTNVSIVTFGEFASGQHYAGFANNASTPGTSPTALGDFGYTELALTNSKQDATDALNFLAAETPFSDYTAMYQGLAEARAVLSGGSAANQYVIFLSDGIDNDDLVSGSTITGNGYTAINTIREATEMKVVDGITIMTIGTDIPGAAAVAGSMDESSYENVQYEWTDWNKASGVNEAALHSFIQSNYTGTSNPIDFTGVPALGPSGASNGNALYDTYMRGSNGGYFDIPGDQYSRDFMKNSTMSVADNRQAEGVQELIYMAQALDSSSVSVGASTPIWGTSNPVLWGHTATLSYGMSENDAANIVSGAPATGTNTVAVAKSTVNSDDSQFYSSAKTNTVLPFQYDTVNGPTYWTGTIMLDPNYSTGVSTWSNNTWSNIFNQATTSVSPYTQQLTDFWGMQYAPTVVATYTYDTATNNSGTAGTWEAAGYVHAMDLRAPGYPDDYMYFGSYAGVYKGVQASANNSLYFDYSNWDSGYNPGASNTPAQGWSVVYSPTDTIFDSWSLDQIEGPEKDSVIGQWYNADTVERMLDGSIRMPYFTPVTTTTEVKDAFVDYANKIAQMGENVKVTAEVNSNYFTILENYNGMSPWYETSGLSGQSATKSGNVVTWNMPAISRTTPNTITYYLSYNSSGLSADLSTYVHNVVYITYADNPGTSGYLNYCKYFPLNIVDGTTEPFGLETTPAPTDYSTGLVGVYPYGTPATAYTPSVTPTPKTLASENLDEGAEDVDVTDDGDDDIDDGGDIDDEVADDEGEAVPATGNPVQNGALAVMISLAVVFAAAYLLRRRAKR